MLLTFYLIFIHSVLFSQALIGENVIEPEDGNLPFVVGIKRFHFGNVEVENDHIITGTLISKKDIVTIENGLDILNGDRFELIIGSTDYRHGTVYTPLWFMTYIQWAFYTRIEIRLEAYGLAMIRLKEDLAENIQPIPLNPIDPTRLVGKDVIIAGWGLNASAVVDRKMKSAMLTVYTKTICLVRMEPLTRRRTGLPDNYVCSFADPYVVTTPGIGGAPVMYQGTIVAVHNAICPALPEGYHPNQINAHLAIRDFADFIYSVVAM